MRPYLLLSLLSLVLAAPAPVPAPLIVPRDGGAVIPGTFIVRLKDGASNLVNEVLNILESPPLNLYQFGDFHGFAAEMSDAIVDKVRSQPNVASITPDTIIQLTIPSVEVTPDPTQTNQKRQLLPPIFGPPSDPSTPSTTPTQPDPSTGNGNDNFLTESNAPWGLARISNKQTGQTQYTYDASAGEGICVYVVDTGIDTSHPQFEGRASFVKNYITNEPDDDLNGHGTHVSGTIGSRDYGVAKKVTLYAVKFLDANGTGSTSNVLDSFNFVANDFQTRGCPNGAILSISAGGGRDNSVNDAANEVVKAGVFFSVAAGNDNADASNDSPASASLACAVGASTETDGRASFSNYGPDVAIWAPGTDILSTYKDGQYATLSGTSMATPHISGLAAYLLAKEGNKSPADLLSRIKDLSQKGKLTGLPMGTVNDLAFNGSPYAKR